MGPKPGREPDHGQGYEAHEADAQEDGKVILEHLFTGSQGKDKCNKCYILSYLFWGCQEGEKGQPAPTPLLGQSGKAGNRSAGIPAGGIEGILPSVLVIPVGAKRKSRCRLSGT